MENRNCYAIFLTRCLFVCFANNKHRDKGKILEQQGYFSNETRSLFEKTQYFPQRTVQKRENKKNPLKVRNNVSFSQKFYAFLSIFVFLNSVFVFVVISFLTNKFFREILLHSCSTSENLQLEVSKKYRKSIVFPMFQ